MVKLGKCNWVKLWVFSCVNSFNSSRKALHKILECVCGKYRPFIKKSICEVGLVQSFTNVCKRRLDGRPKSKTFLHCTFRCFSTLFNYLPWLLKCSTVHWVLSSGINYCAVLGPQALLPTRRDDVGQNLVTKDVNLMSHKVKGGNWVTVLILNKYTWTPGTFIISEICQSHM